MFVLILLTIIVGGLIYWFANGSYGYWKKRGVPNPPTKPFVGNIGQTLIFSKHIGEIYYDIYNKYKDCLYVGFYKIRSPSLVIRDVELLKTILIKDFVSFHDNDIDADESTDPLFALNPFCLKGSKWKYVRAQVTAAITTGKIKNMFNLMRTVTNSLTNYLASEANAQNSKGLDAKELCGRYTTDVVAACAFGLDSNSFTDPNSKFREMGAKIFQPSFIGAIQQSMVFFFPATAKLLRIKFITKEVEDWFIGTLQETIKYREKNNIVRNDYLDLMLSLKNKPGEYQFKDMDIMALAMTFYSDGFETSSIALSFVLYQLAKNPEIQEKLRNEMERVLRKHNNEMTYDAIQDMPYMDMIISETLRMHPPAMFLMKQCTKSFTLPPPRGESTGPSVHIEPGMSIIIPVLAIHYDPQFYPNPEVFDPERFTDEAKLARPKCAYMPFGEGPRQCLGFRFALAQIKAALVAMITKYEVKLNPKTARNFEIDPKSFILMKKGGIWLNFYERK